MLAPAGEKPHRILIRAVNWLGDAVMTTPSICAIRRSFPAAEITLLANPLVSQLFSPHDGIDRIVTFDRKAEHRGFRGRIRLAAELRKHRFDTAIILPNSFDSALVPWLAGIPQRLGKRSDGRGLLLTGRFSPDERPPRCHEVENYLNLVRHFGISAAESAPCLCTTAEETAWAARLLEQHGITEGEVVLGINAGATFGSAKRWYPERFAEVAQRLGSEWKARILLFGGPDETAITGEIERCLQGACLNMAGKTTVRQLMALIRRCTFIVTNDSGPMHIAAAFGVPLAAIFGSTDHATTSPYTAKAVIIRRNVECAPCKLRECPTDHRCMTEVTADDVVQAACGLMERLREPKGAA